MPSCLRHASVVLAFVLSASVYADNAASSFPTNELLRHFKTMGDPQLSPDGQRVLLSVTEPTADGAKTHLWLTGVNGEEPRQLTFSPDSDKSGEHQGEWMPDGQSILFVARRGEHASLYRLPMNGGEAKAFDLKVKPLVDESKLPDALPLKSADGPDKKPADSKAAEKNPDSPSAEEVAIDVASYQVAPDGKWIAIIADDPETPGEKAQKEAKADAEFVDHDPHGSRLYLLEISTSKLTLVPVDPDVHGAEWNADSSKLLAIAEAPNNASDLGPSAISWSVSIADTAHPQKLAELPATIETAAWSLDGNGLIYHAQAKRDAPPGYSDLYTYDNATKSSHNLSETFKGSMRGNSPIPLADGSIVQLVEMGFNGKVAHYTPRSSDPETLPLKPANMSDVATNAKRSGWLFLGSSGGQPPVLYYSASLKDEPRVVKTPSLTPEHIVSIAPKKIEWKSDGFTIEGRLYLPPQAATQHVPLIVEVHGGPARRLFRRTRTLG